ncbi:hypothetical protein [Joostella sp.]|uniref:hypothetical protein n=1 Tax=Joostella sp. TaxID=2231138 RepID=UPI003A90FB23
MTEKKILKYIDTIISNLEKFLDNEKAIQNEKEKKKLELRLEVVQEVKRAFNWGIASEENKQSKRILQLAKSREQDLDTKNQLKEINLYSKIREVIPYIMAVSYKINMEEKHLTEDLLNFCENQLEIIDSSPYKRKIVFPTKEEIETAFKSYTERIKPNKIPSLKVYNQPEVNTKIEELYQMFLNLAS